MKRDPRRQIESAALIFSPMFLVLLAPGSLPFTAFLMGTLIELVRLAPSPKEAAVVAAVMLGFSLFIFLQGGLAENFAAWPLVYAMLMVLAVSILYRRQLTARIGEGSALLASLALLCWVFDRYVTDGASLILLVLTAVPTAYVVAHSLTTVRLTPAHRLALSLWSAAAVVALSIRYVFGVLSLGSMGNPIASAQSSDALSLFLELLLLGASGPVLVQNAFMLVGYLPDTKRMFKRKYWDGYAREAERLSHEHIERFSAEQVSRPQAVAVLLLAAALLVAHRFEIVSLGFVVSFLIAGVPWIMLVWTAWAHERTARRAIGDGGTESRRTPELRPQEIHELALQVERHAATQDAGAWTQRLRERVAEITPSAEALIDAGRPDLALDLVGALSAFWQETGRVEEGRALTESILGRAGEQHTREAGRAQLVLGELAFRQGDQALALEATQKAQELAEEAGDAWVAGRSEFNLARVAFRDQDARRIFQHAERLLAMAGDDVRLKCGAVHMLGWAEHTAGDLPKAMERFEENVALYRASGNRIGEAGELANLGDLAIEIGDLEGGRRYLREAFAVPGATENRHLLCSLIRSTAVLAGQRHHHEQALELLESSNRLYAESGMTPDPGDTMTAKVRSQALEFLGVFETAECEARGANLTTEQAIAAAIETLRPAEPSLFPRNAQD